LTRGIFPSGVKYPACLPSPISDPMVSNRSTNRKMKITSNAPSLNAEPKSSFINVELTSGV
jgi:hypothetical protein